ncbi:hypothetical protein GCM10022261_08440 [Brevibacterium daeguense]|uniref:Uncharacterized protein n=1 Tax=Brevibacterium daeguense TaxID=909936 RepID=A0ABP8EHC5_9MICO
MTPDNHREHDPETTASGTPGTESNPLLLTDAEAWRAWLDEHEQTSDGVWLTIAKKGCTEATSLAYVQAVEEALCSGWIDGHTKKIDHATYKQRFTPRRKRSTWAASNIARVARLTEEGRMRPRGLAEVERAKADGRWEAAARAARPDEQA